MSWTPLSPWRPIAGTGQNLTLGAASVASALFNHYTQAVQLSSLGNCHVRVGPLTPLAAPVANAPTTATTGGTLAAATYFYKVTAINAYGETVPSNEVSITTTGATSTVTVTWGAVTGATGYKVYRGTAAGSESVFYSPGNVLTFTDTGAAATAGTPPATTTAGNPPVATATDMLIKATDNPYVMRVGNDEVVAVIQDATAAGVLNVIELSH